MRNLECLRLRVQDVDFALGTMTIRDGKGHKNRAVLLPRTCAPHLVDHPSCDIAEQAIEHPTEVGVQLTHESMDQGQRRSSMSDYGTTEASNIPLI